MNKISRLRQEESLSVGWSLNTDCSNIKKLKLTTNEPLSKCLGQYAACSSHCGAKVPGADFSLCIWPP